MRSWQTSIFIIYIKSSMRWSRILSTLRRWIFILPSLLAKSASILSDLSGSMVRGPTTTEVVQSRSKELIFRRNKEHFCWICLFCKHFRIMKAASSQTLVSDIFNRCKSKSRVEICSVFSFIIFFLVIFKGYWWKIILIYSPDASEALQGYRKRFNP